jgi:hypothetical protein
LLTSPQEAQLSKVAVWERKLAKMHFLQSLARVHYGEALEESKHMTRNALNIPEATLPTTKLLPLSEITDKRGYGQRWSFQVRFIDGLLAQGMPHLKIGKRRVRIIISEADAWMRERFRTQRYGPSLRGRKNGQITDTKGSGQ